MNRITTLAACVVALQLSACGESDLADLQGRAIAEAQAEQVAQEANAGAGETDSDTDTSDASGSTDSSDAGDSTETTTDTVDSAETTDTTTDVTDTSDSTDGSDSSSEPDTAAALPVVDLADYTLVFEDKFNGPSVDSALWNTELPWGDDVFINEEMQVYVNTQAESAPDYSPFAFDDTGLVISADITPDSFTEAQSYGQPYVSGVLSSKGKFSFTYGYVEAMINVPEGAGLWPALWLLAENYGDLRPQIYLMEYDGSRPGSVFHNYIFHDGDGVLRSPGQREVTGQDMSVGWHRIGLVWNEGELLFLVDGVATYHITGEYVPREPMYLVANMAVGGIWTGEPDANTMFPAPYQIDYIRVYTPNN